MLWQRCDRDLVNMVLNIGHSTAMTDYVTLVAVIRRDNQNLNSLHLGSPQCSRHHNHHWADVSVVSRG